MSTLTALVDGWVVKTHSSLRPSDEACPLSTVTVSLLPWEKYKNCRSPLGPQKLFLLPQHNHITSQKKTSARTPSPCGKPPPPAGPPQASFSPLNPSALPSQVDLNFKATSRSKSSLFSINTSTLDFPVTTASPTPWLPSSSPSLPAVSAHQTPCHSLQQDFVLFDQPTHPNNLPKRALHNLTGLRLPNRRHSSHQQHQSEHTSISIQSKSQLSAAGNGYLNLSPSDRPSSANIAGSIRGSDQNTSGSSRQTSRLVRPPVPLFAESTPSIPQPDSANMNIADFEEFTGFEGGASTAYSSPSAPSVFDMPSGSHNIGTVSPQDLLIQDPYMSAPNSTAFTALTSPSPFESPEYMDGYDVSPNFGSSGEYDVAGSQWFSLFPDQNASVETTGAEQPLGDRVQNSTVSESPRRKSSGSPASGRHSSVAGVNARKRDKPLPPIVVENPDDVVAMKRARNTLAARKSRERKMQRFEDLEEKIRKLEAERDHWKTLALGQSTSD